MWHKLSISATDFLHFNEFMYHVAENYLQLQVFLAHTCSVLRAGIPMMLCLDPHRIKRCYATVMCVDHEIACIATIVFLPLLPQEASDNLWLQIGS